MKFKVGDRVKRIKSYNTNGKTSQFEIGESGTIMEYDGQFFYSVKMDKNGEIMPRNSGEYLELISNNSDDNVHINECRLNSLLEIAEKGRQAAIELNLKYSNDILYSNNMKVEPFKAASYWGLGYGFIKKPEEKEFKSFIVAEGLHNWKVERPNNHVLRIGCKAFDWHQLKKALDHLINLNQPSAHNELYATKDGIKYLAYCLEWREAEKIYKAMVEYDNETK